MAYRCEGFLRTLLCSQADADFDSQVRAPPLRGGEPRALRSVLEGRTRGNEGMIVQSW